MIRIGIVVCSWNERKHVPNYLNAVLENLKNQRHPFHLDVLVSDNVSSPNFINQLAGWCKRNSSNHTTFSYISENVPRPNFDTANLGFFTLKNSGEYDFLAYSADDIYFTNSDGLEKVMKEFEKPDIGIVSPHVGGDNTVPYFPHLVNEEGETIEIKVGEHVNWHFMVFSKYFMEKFNYRYTDVLAAWGNECFIWFQCASIGKKWLLHKGKDMINGRSVPGFIHRKPRGINGLYLRNTPNERLSKKPSSSPEEITKSLEKVLRPGYEVGFGFQAFHSISGLPIDQVSGGFWMDYNRSLYTESGEIKDPEPLYRWLIENAYMPDMDYQSRFDAATKHLVIG